MDRKLAVSTVVAGEPGSGAGFAVFGPDDDVPGWAAKQIGDHCWEGGASSEAATAAGAEAPPRGGPGSGRDAWVAYCEANGVEVGDDDKQSDLIAKCEQAGLVDPAE